MDDCANRVTIHAALVFHRDSMRTGKSQCHTSARAAVMRFLDDVDGLCSPERVKAIHDTLEVCVAGGGQPVPLRQEKSVEQRKRSTSQRASVGS